jgi:hypothetical protein
VQLIQGVTQITGGYATLWGTWIGEGGRGAQVCGQAKSCDPVARGGGEGGENCHDTLGMLNPQ